MTRRTLKEEAIRNDGTGPPLRRIVRVALASALVLPLLVACGEDDVAKQEPAAPAAPPATAEAPATTSKPAAPAGVPGAIESTDKAIQAVPPAQPGKQ